MRILIKSKIESLDEQKVFESKAIKDLNKLKYMEDDALVVLEKKDNSIILRRDTKESIYTLIFNLDKSTLEYNLKNNNISFKTDFKTNKIDYNDNNIIILYTLEDINYKYEVIMKEDL